MFSIVRWLRLQPNRCGTQAPVWVNMPETHIPSPGAEVVVQACSSWSSPGQETNCCFYPYSVTVRNCGEFFVYRLSSTQACNIAYCVESEVWSLPRCFLPLTNQLFGLIIFLLMRGGWASGIWKMSASVWQEHWHSSYRKPSHQILCNVDQF